MERDFPRRLLDSLVERREGIESKFSIESTSSECSRDSIWEEVEGGIVEIIESEFAPRKSVVVQRIRCTTSSRCFFFQGGRWYNETHGLLFSLKERSASLVYVTRRLRKYRCLYAPRFFYLRSTRRGNNVWKTTPQLITKEARTDVHRYVCETGLKTGQKERETSVSWDFTASSSRWNERKNIPRDGDSFN